MTPTGTTPHPLWPYHEGIFGASDASRHEPSPTSLATEDESENFSRIMQDKTHTNTAPPPYLKLAAQLKSDATIIAKALKDTEEHGKDKPVLLWIFYHEGIKHKTYAREKYSPRMVPL